MAGVCILCLASCGFRRYAALMSRRLPARKKLVRVVVQLPLDWKHRLDKMRRHRQPLSSLIRELIRPHIDTESRPLSEVPLGRPSN